MSYERLTSDNAGVLFIDHQTGLANGVQTQSPPEFINNVRALVRIAQIYKLPIDYHDELRRRAERPDHAGRGRRASRGNDSASTWRDQRMGQQGLRSSGEEDGAKEVAYRRDFYRSLPRVCLAVGTRRRIRRVCGAGRLGHVEQSWSRTPQSHAWFKPASSR